MEGPRPLVPASALIRKADNSKKYAILQQLRHRMRTLHYSTRTEEAYCDWVRRFVLFHGRRHPSNMGKDEIAAGLILLRRHAPDMPRPYRMWLYPVPAVVALLGWVFVFATTQFRVILFGVGVRALGCLAFLLWSRRPNQRSTAGI